MSIATSVGVKLAELKDHSFDLLISNIGMADIDAIAFLRYMTALEVESKA
ncbi:MAG: hypothetical protein ACAF41_06320 [Leptolyngbya sp. BL-A-14]